MSSTFGSFDLTGFAKPAVWWYKSWWLLSVDDNDAGKPFSTTGEHTVRIVESWAKPAAVPLANGTDVTVCDSTVPGQEITFSGSGSTAGTLTDVNGRCIDGLHGLRCAAHWGSTAESPLAAATELRT